VANSGDRSLKFEFSGAYDHALDPKGRLTLPAVFRRDINEKKRAKFSICLDKKCLVIHPRPVWLKFMEVLNSLQKNDPEAREFKRTMLATAFDCEVDGQGRVLVPPSLRALAGITRDVTLIGNGETVEVWDRARWEEYFRLGQEHLELNARKLPLGGQ